MRPAAETKVPNDVGPYRRRRRSATVGYAEFQEATMKAAVVRDFHAPLRIEERPMPTPGAGQVVVKIETSGLCHTDIHAAHGDWPVKPALPFVPGHEGVGLVSAVGRGVTQLSEGDRVAIPWLGWACGACE